MHENIVENDNQNNFNDDPVDNSNDPVDNSNGPVDNSNDFENDFVEKPSDFNMLDPRV